MFRGYQNDLCYENNLHNPPIFLYDATPPPLTNFAIIVDCSED